ncbi:hypothetical protein BRDID11002_22620 [Bradyrhizobium diazoefficiens]
MAHSKGSGSALSINQAGPVAMAHNLSEEAKIAPAITIGVVSGKDATNGSRPGDGDEATDTGGGHDL